MQDSCETNIGKQTASFVSWFSFRKSCRTGTTSYCEQLLWGYNLAINNLWFTHKTTYTQTVFYLLTPKDFKPSFTLILFNTYFQQVSAKALCVWKDLLIPVFLKSYYPHLKRTAKGLLCNITHFTGAKAKRTDCMHKLHPSYAPAEISTTLLPHGTNLLSLCWEETKMALKTLEGKGLAWKSSATIFKSGLQHCDRWK